MQNWRIVKSQTSKTMDGFPAGQILFRTESEALQFMEKTDFEKPIMEKYKIDDSTKEKE